MARSELTTDRDDIERWADEHAVVPIRRGDRVELRREEELESGDERIEWEEFHRSVADEDMAVMRYGESADRREISVTDRTSALDRVTVEGDEDRDEIEARLLEGETVTGTITETTVVERTIVEEATLESEVVDREVIDRRVIDVELRDRECHSCDLVGDGADLEGATGYEDHRFLVDDTDVVSGEAERYEGFPFDLTAEVDEDWAVTIEERERYTVETRIADVDVTESDEIEDHDLEARVDVDAVHEHLLDADLIEVDLEDEGVVDTETYDIESEFAEDDAIRTYLTSRRTVDREVSERRRLTADVVEGELLSREVERETVRERGLSERETAVAGGDEAVVAEDVDEDVEVVDEEMRTVPEEGDVGKPVVVPTGDRIGMVSAVENGIAYVDPHPGLTEKISAKLGWGGIDEEDFPLDERRVARITNDAVRLSGEYDEEDLAALEERG